MRQSRLLCHSHASAQSLASGRLQSCPHARPCGLPPPAPATSILYLADTSTPYQPFAKRSAPQAPIDVPDSTGCQRGQIASASNHESRLWCRQWSAGCVRSLFAQLKWRATNPLSDQHPASPSIVKTAVRRQTVIPHSDVAPPHTACQMLGKICRNRKAP